MTAKSMRVLGWLVAGGSLFLSAHSAHAQAIPVQGNPLGFYVGAGAGISTIRQDAETDTLGYSLSRSEAAWDVFMGIRPSPYLGAEIGYLDFGSARAYPYIQSPYAWNGQGFHESADAPVAFAVGYIPLQPWWDLYVKAGGARLHKSWDSMAPVPCDPPGPCLLTYSSSEVVNNWDFAYGVGSQVRYGPLAYRVEYVRVSANNNPGGGDPDLLSVGVSWTFF